MKGHLFKGQTFGNQSVYCKFLDSGSRWKRWIWKLHKHSVLASSTPKYWWTGKLIIYFVEYAKLKDLTSNEFYVRRWLSWRRKAILNSNKWFPSSWTPPNWWNYIRVFLPNYQIEGYPLDRQVSILSLFWTHPMYFFSTWTVSPHLDIFHLQIPTKVLMVHWFC